MQRNALRRFGAVVCFLCAMVPGKAQTGEVQTLRVEIKCDSPEIAPRYVLELYDVRSHQKAESVELQPDGAFTLRNVAYGDYQLMITDESGSPIHQEFVTVSGVTPSLTVQFAAPKRAQAPGGLVSVKQLQHPPTKKAFQAMVAAQKFSEAGNYQKAAEELSKAVQLSPYYADAYTNLAAQHVRLGRYDDACGELEKALEIGGPNPVLLTNLASAQLAMKRVAESEKSARWALKLAPDFPQAHYILGTALSMDTRTVQEGLEHLRAASQTLPSALAQIDRVRAALAHAHATATR